MLGAFFQSSDAWRWKSKADWAWSVSSGGCSSQFPAWACGGAAPQPEKVGGVSSGGRSCLGACLGLWAGEVDEADVVGEVRSKVTLMLLPPPSKTRRFSA